MTAERDYSSSSQPLPSDDSRNDERNENDPSNYLSRRSTSSNTTTSSGTTFTLVKVHDSSIDTLNGQLGIVKGYNNRHRGRYDVEFFLYRLST